MEKDNKKIIIIMAILLVLIICIIFVVNKTSNSNTENKNSTQSENSNVNESSKEDESNTSSDSSNNDEKDFSDYTTYKINLSEKSEKVEITEKGVYTLTGNLNGYIYVNTEENVKLVLDNVTIKNSSGPAIYVLSAKNTYIELVGTSTISDGETYSNFDEDVNATIYSKDDLFITGSGTLNVNANFEDGIVSKDDLTIYSGTINVTSADDAIRGKDSVVIYDGKINITSTGDGIKTTNSEDTEKGNIIIENGTITINSQNDGIQSENSITINGGTFDITTGNGSKIIAKTNEFGNYTTSTTDTDSMKGIKAEKLITINGGTIKINAADDGIHSNGNIVINKGNYTISSSDDAVHANGLTEINGGEFNIIAAEGIEATYVKINNGTINIEASDDGINAGRKSTDYSVMIEINGGDITIKMGSGDTDGIDSNGDLYINGGTINVTGNSPFDYDGQAKYTGGKLIVNGQETTSITNQMMGGGMMGGRGNMTNNQMSGGMVQGRMMR